MLESLLMSGKPVGASDPYWANVALLLRAEDFTDSSNNHFSVSNSGASLDTTVKKYGNSSFNFASSGQRLTIATSTLLNPGTGDFTCEGWINASSGYNTNYDHLFGKGNGVDAGTFEVAIYQNKVTVAFGGTIYQGVTLLSPNTWYHVAVSRTSGACNLTLNGAIEKSFTSSYNLTSSSSYNVGDRQAGDSQLQYPFLGHVDNHRLTIGVGRYPSAFTVPGDFPTH